MNGGAYGRETKDVLVEARGVDRAGNIRVYTNAEMAFTFGIAASPDEYIFTQALFQGTPGDPAPSRPRWTRSPKRARRRSR